MIMNGKEFPIRSRRPFPSVLVLAFMLCLTGFGERALFAANPSPVPRVRFDPGNPPNVPPDVPLQVLINEPFTFKVRFKNNANVFFSGAKTGYGAFIDLVLDAGGANMRKPPHSPACLCDGITFVKANMVDVNGGAVPLVFYKSQAPCAPSTSLVTLIHPFDSSLVLPVQVPAGSQLVTLELPFGSFDPTQPEIVVEVTANVSPLADVSPPTPLNIYARGGFRYGKDPLDDPILDFPVLSDLLDLSLNPPSNDPLNQKTDSTQWSAPAQAQTTPTLITVTKKYLGPEDETATGPNFVQRYRITLDIANQQTVNNVTVTDHLPNNMAYHALVLSPLTTACFLPPFQEPAPIDQANSGLANDLILKCSSITGVLGPDATIVFEFFIPEKDAHGNPVLPPDCSTPTTSVNDIEARGDWFGPTPPDACDTYTQPIVSNVTLNDHTLLDKCLAIQKSVAIFNDSGTLGFTPGDTLKYTLNFQISDFRTIGKLTIADRLSDGQLLLTSPPPVLTVGDQFSNGNINVNFTPNANLVVTGDPTSTCPGIQGMPNIQGTTNLVFDVSGAMSAAAHPRLAAGLLTGGFATVGGPIFPPPTTPAVGQIVFYAQILDQFMFTQQPGDKFVDKDDPLTNCVEIKGSVYKNEPANAVPASIIGSTQDDSKTAIAIVTDFLVKTVYAIYRPTSPNPFICGPNTTPCPAKPEVMPGDLVTFRLEKTIPSSDAEHLTIQDWLPLPVFNVADPNADNTAGPPWSFNPSISSNDPPPSGTAWPRTSDTLSAWLAPPTPPPTLIADVPTNSITFNYGTFNDPTNTPRKIDLLFTVTVTSTPFADGLYLTNEAQECESNTFGVTFCQTAIAQVHVREPALKITKGVVAATNPNAVFTPTLVGQVHFNPPPAGSCGTRFSPNIISSPFTPIDSNISSVDANDCVTFAIVVENTGGAPAYDIQLQDLFPLSGGRADCFAPVFFPDSFCVTDGTGTPIPVTPTVASIPGTLPITLSNPLPGLSSTSTPGKNIVVITFDACVIGNIKPHCCDNTAKVVNYASTPNGPNFVGGTIQDAAQVCVVPKATKFIKTTSEAHTSATQTPRPLAIGEIIRYHIEVVVPETILPSNYVVQDTLPAGMEYLGGSYSTVSISPSITATNPPVITAPPGCSGGNVTFNFGFVTNGDPNTSTQEMIILEYDALVCNAPSNVDQAQLANSARVLVDNQPVSPPSSVLAVVVEPKLTITKTVSPNPVLQGGTVTYMVTISTNAGTADAFDVNFSDILPPGLTFVPNSLIVTGGCLLPVVSPVAPAVTCGTVPISGPPVIIKYQAVATTCPATLTNLATVTWTSLPGPQGTTISNGTHSITPGVSGAVDGERNGTTAPALLNKYAATTSVPLTVKCPPCVPPSSLPAMVAWWPLDETSGPTVADIVGGHTGTAQPQPIGGPTGPGPVTSQLWPPPAFQPGMVATSLFFSGSRRIEVLTDPALEPGTGDFSIDAWVIFSPGGAGNVRPIVSKYSTSTPGYSLNIQDVSATQSLLTFVVNGPSFAPILTATITPQSWHHVAATLHRGNPGTMALYLDGALVQSDIVGSGGVVANNLPVLIGGDGTSKGEIAVDEVELFNSALDLATIKSLWDARSAGKCKCLLVTNDRVSCNPNGTFSYTFTVTNLTGAVLPAGFVTLVPQTLGVAITPIGLPSALPPGIPTTFTVTISVSSAFPGGSICFTALVASPSAPICSVDHCITLPQCCAVPPSGMVAWWPLEETSGPTVADIAGNLPNHNGTSMPGPINSGGPTSLPAEVNNGLLFCGSPTPAFVTVADKPDLNFGTAQDFSIDSWIKTSNTSGFQMIVDKLNWPNPTAGYRFYVDNTNSLKFDIGPGAAFSSTTVLTPGTWYHVAVVVGRTQPFVTFYINGSPSVVSGTSTNNFNASSLFLNLLIGGTHETQLQSLLGCRYVLDEVEIFKRALLATEVQSIYRAGSAGKCKCALVNSEKISCNSNGSYTYTFTVTNSSNATVSSVTFAPPSGVTITPSSITSPSLPPGGSTTTTVTISGPGAAPGSNICLTVALGGPGVGVCSTDHCIKLPRCPRRISFD
jgi:uncharacterized repeat protein (TIGR01451 family)/fimbrial isopeptide formation D2 family protein